MATKRTTKRSKAQSAKASVELIPNAELDVLACVLRAGPVEAGRIREMMYKYRPMAHGSVVTLLTRLEDKGLVTKEKGPVGKAFLFQSARKPDVLYKSLVKDMATRVFAGDTGVMVSALLEAQPPTKDELTVIQRAVGKAKRGAKASRR